MKDPQLVGYATVIDTTIAYEQRLIDDTPCKRLEDAQHGEAHLNSAPGGRDCQWP